MVARRTNRLVALGVLLATLLLTACTASGASGQPPATAVAPANGALTVRAFEWGFEPETIVLQRGEEGRIVLDKDGAILQNLKLEGLEAEPNESVRPGPLTCRGGPLIGGADAGPAGPVILSPQQSGEFTFYCTLEQHQRLGMEGTLIVE